MSSEPVVASGMRERQRLHSEYFRWSIRLFAVLFVTGAVRLLYHQLFDAVTVRSNLEALLDAGVLVLMAWCFWMAPRRVLVADRGIVFRSGRSLRLVPWGDVVELREVSTMLLHPPWHPKSYELVLKNGEAIEFVGRRQAREIVNASRPHSV